MKPLRRTIDHRRAPIFRLRAPFRRLCALWVLALMSLPAGAAVKESSVFYPEPLMEAARRNIARDPWAARVRDQLVAAARPWREMSDEALWRLMFGPTITRAWMVWSNGHCPACKQAVPMYNWTMDALREPWRVRCPHCREAFPKNDFGRFYRSGLDARGVFDPKRADRSLLFNAEHPDPADPLHRFGVDDGEGYVEGQNRWRFIGAYLVYGQWKQAVLGGIKALADAYIVTGEPVYARKAAILLDRVADLYPGFDYKTQATVYERPGAAGYVSTWHDACEETRELAMAYDQIRGGLAGDETLTRFLAAKAQEHGLSNPKATAAEVCRNIEAGILREVLSHSNKIQSNYPRTDVALVVIRSVLDWEGDRAGIEQAIDRILARTTAVDGMTGEKGLANYSTIGPRAISWLLGMYARAEPDFLAGVLRRHPRLRETFRFHVDTFCLGAYYPLSGDTGAFALPVPHYLGVEFNDIPLVDQNATPSLRREGPAAAAAKATLAPSPFGFLWRMYQETGDTALAQVLYQANGREVDGIPYDLFAADPAAMRRELAAIIRRAGETPRVGSVNKQQWRLAILRAGEGPRARAAWLDYDAGGGHGHLDGLNLGLFAKGLDLLPDFGYPPVQYGGWGSARAGWYRMTASHNTVVVDGASQQAGRGETTLWAEGRELRAIRAAAPALIGGGQYERTVVMVDLSDADSYLLDLFRVEGGRDHAYFLHSHFGEMETRGLTLQEAPAYGHGAQLRGFRTDPAPQIGWSAEWKVEDRYRLLPPGTAVRLRRTDLTEGAQASVCEAWVALWGFSQTEEAWIPRLMVRRQAQEAPLASTFVGVIEPFERRSNLAGIRRLPLPGASDVAVEVTLADGRRDLLVAIDPAKRGGASPVAVLAPPHRLRLEGELCWLRLDRAGAVRRVALCRGTALTLPDFTLRLKEPVEFLELRLEQGRATVVSGPADAVESLTRHGRPVPLAP